MYCLNVNYSKASSLFSIYYAMYTKCYAFIFKENMFFFEFNRLIFRWTLKDKRCRILLKPDSTEHEEKQPTNYYYIFHNTKD